MAAIFLAFVTYYHRLRYHEHDKWVRKTVNMNIQILVIDSSQ